MESNFLKFYPQFTKLTDRRQQSQSIEFDRRSSQDRRQDTRTIDPKLYADLNKVQDTFKAFIHNTDQFKSTVNNLDNKAHHNKELTHAAFAAFSPIVPLRRISSIPDNIEDKNYERAAGILGLMIFNLPEDCRDMRNSIKQISDIVLPEKTKNSIQKQFPKIYETFVEYKKPYDYTKFQHSFSFFKGTWFEPLLKLPGKLGKQISDTLYCSDKTLYSSKVGKCFRKLLKISEGADSPTGIFDIKGREIFAKSIEGGNELTRLIGRSMLRIPVLGIYVLSLLELPAIIKSLKKGETVIEKAGSVSKQTAKSTIFVTAMSSGMGIFGALGFKKFGATGSLIGMGIGSIIGGLISQKAGEVIEKA